MQEFGLTHTNIANPHWHEMKIQATHVNHSMYPPGWTADLTLPTHLHPQTWPFPRWVFPEKPEYWLPGKVLEAQPVLGGNRGVGDGQSMALKLLPWSSPRPKGDVRSRMPGLGACRSWWDGGRTDTDCMDAASAQPWEGGGNRIGWIEEIRPQGFQWKLFSPVQMSLGTKFSC